MTENSSRTERYKAHTNLETVRKCPYCEDEVLARGLYMHVYNSEGNGHAPRGEVPEGFSVDNAEIVGRRSVTIDRPTKYQVDHRRFVCDYCGETFKGELGLNVHLGRKAGKDDLHPKNADERDPESFENFPATEDGKIIVTDEVEAEGISHDEGIIVADEQTVEDMESNIEEQVMVPISELEQLYLKFMDDHESDRDISAYHAAERVGNLIEKYRDQAPEAKETVASAESN